MKTLFKATFFLLLLSAAWPSAVRGEPLRRVTFLPQWFPQAQFAGYYVAAEKGFYRQKGIEAVILTGGSDKEAASMLKSRKADFATMWLCTALRSRDRGIPVVDISQIVGRSSQILVARKSKGIRSVRDMDGRTVGVFPGDFTILPELFAKKYRLKLRLVPMARSINLFFWDGVDVTSACIYNEYHTILDSGLNPDELTVFRFSDLGLDFPEDGIYCLSDFYEKDPGLCRDFAAASRQGWEYAFDHPEEALDIVMAYVTAANVGSNRVHQRWMLGRMKELVRPVAGRPIGGLSEQSYLTVARGLKQEGTIKDYPAFATFYKGNDSPHGN